MKHTKQTSSQNHLRMRSLLPFEYRILNHTKRNHFFNTTSYKTRFAAKNRENKQPLLILPKIMAKKADTDTLDTKTLDRNTLESALNENSNYLQPNTAPVDKIEQQTIINLEMLTKREQYLFSLIEALLENLDLSPICTDYFKIMDELPNKGFLDIIAQNKKVKIY